jgi:hypothetical protein
MLITKKIAIASPKVALAFSLRYQFIGAAL